MEQFITVKQVYPAGPGKKTGAVIDTNGVRWGVWASDLGHFAAGASYKIWDWDSRMYQGKQYQTIKSDGYQFMSNGGAMPNMAPQQAQRAPVSPQRTQGPAPNFDDVTRRRDIFVCGALNNFLSNQAIAGLLFTNDVLDGKKTLELVWRLRKVFDYGLGPSAQDPSISTAPVGSRATPEQQAEAALGYPRVDGETPRRNNAMDDEIPF